MEWMESEGEALRSFIFAVNSSLLLTKEIPVLDPTGTAKRQEVQALRLSTSIKTRPAPAKPSINDVASNQRCSLSQSFAHI